MQIHHTVRELLASSYDNSRAPSTLGLKLSAANCLQKCRLRLELPTGMLGACLLSCSVLEAYRNALCLAGTFAVVSAHAGNLLY
jgi:hypothetical protein